MLTDSLWLPLKWWLQLLWLQLACTWPCARSSSVSAGTRASSNAQPYTDRTDPSQSTLTHLYRCSLAGWRSSGRISAMLSALQARPRVPSMLARYHHGGEGAPRRTRVRPCALALVPTRLLAMATTKRALCSLARCCRFHYPCSHSQCWPPLLLIALRSPLAMARPQSLPCAPPPASAIYARSLRALPCA